VKTIEVDEGVEIAYREWGTADAPALVLLHGGGLSSAEWTDAAPRFADTHRVIAPDARGCGDSDDDPQQRYGVLDIVADVEALRAQLGIARFALLGHSFGAVAACVYAATYPAVVGALVMVDGGPADHVRPASLHDPPLLFETREAAAEALARSLPRGYPSWYLDSRFVTLPDQTLTWHSDMAGRVAWSKAGGEPLIKGLWPYVEKLQARTLVLRGADSPLFPLDNAVKMTRVNPHVRLVDVPHAGHFVHIDQPEVFVAVVDAFLAE
jgi:pimeloyl-ACP methyl ester carboxylesterase